MVVSNCIVSAAIRQAPKKMIPAQTGIQMTGIALT